MKLFNVPPKEDDECTIVGKRFAIQLRSMTQNQRLLAEKIISDVMYCGRMEKLTEQSNFKPFLPQKPPNRIYSHQPINQVLQSYQSQHLLKPLSVQYHHQSKQQSKQRGTGELKILKTQIDENENIEDFVYYVLSIL